MLGDFRLWRSIFQGLEAQATFHPNQQCRSNAAFQLALCYQVGFGCNRCEIKSLYWLSKSGKCADQLKEELAFIQANTGPWYYGMIRELGEPRLEKVYNANGILTEAEKVYRQLILDLECVLSKDHTAMIEQKARLADILNEQGRFSEAQTILLATLASCKKRSSLPVVRALTKTYYFMGRFEDMEALILEEKELWDQAQRKSSVAFYDVNAMEEEHILGILAVAYYQQGKYKEAESTVIKRIDLAKTLYGEAHQRTLAGTTDLAAMFIGSGQTSQAREMLHHAIPIAERILGRDDAEVLHMNMQLSLAFSGRRERKMAEAVATRNLEVCKRVLGDRHKTTLDTMESLGLNLDLQGRRHEALQLRETCLKISSESLGEKHPRTAEAMSLLANSYFRLVRWEEGEILKSRAVEVYNRTLGKHHPDTVGAARRLARMRRCRRLWGMVGRVIPKCIILGAAQLVEGFYAWVERVLHYYA